MHTQIQQTQTDTKTYAHTCMQAQTPSLSLFPPLSPSPFHSTHLFISSLSLRVSSLPHHVLTSHTHSLFLSHSLSLSPSLSLSLFFSLFPSLPYNDHLVDAGSSFRYRFPAQGSALTCRLLPHQQHDTIGNKGLLSPVSAYMIGSSVDWFCLFGYLCWLFALFYNNLSLDIWSTRGVRQHLLFLVIVPDCRHA